MKTVPSQSLLKEAQGRSASIEEDKTLFVAHRATLPAWPPAGCFAVQSRVPDQGARLFGVYRARKEPTGQCDAGWGPAHGRPPRRPPPPNAELVGGNPRSAGCGVL